MGVNVDMDVVEPDQKAVSKQEAFLKTRFWEPWKTAKNKIHGFDLDMESCSISKPFSYRLIYYILYLWAYVRFQNVAVHKYVDDS